MAVSNLARAADQTESHVDDHITFGEDKSAVGYLPVGEGPPPEDNGSYWLLASETDVGSTLLTEQASSNVFFGQSDAGPPWNLNFQYTYKKATSSNSGGTGNIVDITNEYNGGMGWSGASGWGFGFKADYEHTAAEALTVRGTSAFLSRRWTEKEDEKFSPYFGLVLNGGTSNFVETFSGSLKTRNGRVTARPVTGSNELRQSYGGVDAAWSRSAKFDFGLGIKVFGFNRNVAGFLNLLDSPVGLSRGMGGFSGTISGLPSSSYAGHFGWSISPDAKFVLDETILKIVVTGQLESDTRLTIEGQLNKTLAGTVGYEHDFSPGTNSWDFIVGLAWVI